MYRGQPWHEEAACAGMSLEVFFPHRERGASGLPYEAVVGLAKSVCAECPVAALCLEEALSYPMSEDAGVRGGLTLDERNKLRRRRA